MDSLRFVFRSFFGQLFLYLCVSPLKSCPGVILRSRGPLPPSVCVCLCVNINTSDSADFVQILTLSMVQCAAATGAY